MGLKLATAPLGREEQKLYSYLEAMDKNSFKVSEIDAPGLGVGRDYLYVLVGRLARKGWLTRVGKGVYLRLPACTALDGGAYLEDTFEVGMKMFRGYVAFHSALRVHRLSEHQPFTIFMATRGRSETVPLLRYYEVKAVKLGRRFTGFTEEGKYVVSTKAKTFFDCFEHPQYAGGYPELLKCLFAAGGVDWKEMEAYVSAFGSSSLCQKMGYLLSMMGETGFEVPGDFLEYLRGRVRNKTRLIHALRGGRYARDWMVMDNIGRESLLSWWHHG